MLVVGAINSCWVLLVDGLLLVSCGLSVVGLLLLLMLVVVVVAVGDCDVVDWLMVDVVDDGRLLDWFGLIWLN